MYAVIDVGSNSVRLMLSDGDKSVKKYVETTRLAEGVAKDNMLQYSAIERSVNAVKKFVTVAQSAGVGDVYIFATEAVRRADNGVEFVELVKKSVGISVQVLSGEQESVVGFVGASGGKKCTVIDIGGASTEIACGCNGKVNYAKSVRIGAVVLRDTCGESEELLKKYLDEKTLEYGEVPVWGEVIAIGGTATSIGAMLEKMEEYNPDKVHNRLVGMKELEELYSCVKQMNLSERLNCKGLMPGRIDIIVGAMYEMLYLMNMLNVDTIRLSESDNLEGFLQCKLKGML